MMENLRYKITKFMQGRYGVDNLSRFLLWVLVGIIVVNTFVRSSLLHLIQFVLLIVLLVQQLCSVVILSNERNMVRLSLDQSGKREALMARQASRTEEELRREIEQQKEL